MIKGFINAHYRSGSTLFQKLIAYSNPEIATLHEPTSPIILNGIQKFLGRNQPMHHWEVHEGYGKLSDKCFNKFKANHRGGWFFTQGNVIFNTLNPLHECNQEIMFKANQIHLFLNKVADKYNCNYVHMIRNPANNFTSTIPGRLRNEESYKEIANGTLDDKILAHFGVPRLYEVGSNRLNVKQKHKFDWIGKYLISWAYANNEAVKQAENSEKGLVIRFEDLINKPTKTFKLIAEHMDIDMDFSLTQDFDMNRGMRKLPVELFKAFDLKTEELKIKEKCNDLIKYFPEYFSE